MVSSVTSGLCTYTQKVANHDSSKCTTHTLCHVKPWSGQG